jgi:serine/threonine protein kinase
MFARRGKRESDMAELIGQKLGQYGILSVLGEGGMSTVYRARQASIQRDVAVKVIEAKMTNDTAFLKRFEREAQLIASLSHTHIVKVFDYGQQNNVIYLVMELLSGGSLNELLQKGPLAPDRVFRLVDQVTSALDYAHQKGVVHRDLKPQNLMFDESGNVLLTDFGLARLVNQTSAMTQTGLTLGTPAYMSPEQWTHDSVDGRSDIYAFGITLFQMITGKLPFNGDTPYRLMYQHLYDQPPSVLTINPRLPAGLDLVIMQALAKDPDTRFNTAGEMAAAFRAAVTNPVRMQNRAQTGPLQSRPQTGPLPTLALTPAQTGPLPKLIKRLAIEAGHVRTDPRDIAQVYVPAGQFSMGSTAQPNARGDEQPIHDVRISSAFWLDQYAVTNTAYKAFVEDGGYAKSQYWSNNGWQWLTVNGISGPGNYTGFAEPQQPRVGVSWYEADAYARWRGGRLPTEAQWEYAARGSQGLIYPWGNVFQDTLANVRGTRTKPVGTYPDGKSWIGAYDLAGNVWEWVADWYDEDYYAQSNGLDPVGPATGSTKVLRGGSWSHNQDMARGASRRREAALTRENYIGFRIITPAATE